MITTLEIIGGFAGLAAIFVIGTLWAVASYRKELAAKNTDKAHGSAHWHGHPVSRVVRTRVRRAHA